MRKFALNLRGSTLRSIRFSKSRTDPRLMRDTASIISGETTLTSVKRWPSARTIRKSPDIFPRRRHRGRGRRLSRRRRVGALRRPRLPLRPGYRLRRPVRGAVQRRPAQSPRRPSRWTVALSGGTPPASYTSAPAAGQPTRAAAPPSAWLAQSLRFSSPATASAFRDDQPTTSCVKRGAIGSAFTARAQGLRLSTKRTRPR